MTDKPTPKRASKKATPRAYHKGNVSADLLRVAAALLKTERFEDVTLRRLCREVGVTPGNFYNHFQSLEWLLLDLAADGFEQQKMISLRHAKSAPSRDEAIVAVIVAMVEFGHANPELFRIMFGQISNEIVRTHERFNAASLDAFARLVEIVYGEDIFRPDDVVWSHAHCGKAYALFSFAYGLARVISMEQITFTTGTKAERTEFVESMARVFVQGLGQPNAAQSSAKVPTTRRA